MRDLNRRRFLTLPLALALAPLTSIGRARAAERQNAAESRAQGDYESRTAAESRARADLDIRAGAYDVEVGILYDVFSLHLPGTLTETIDRAAGRYEVTAVGRGGRIANRVESRGIRREGRWAPLQATGWFSVAGRESKSEVRYDYERRVVEYHYRGETFLLRRLRVADDVLAMPAGVHLDDVISATLNFADGTWPLDADGVYRTQVVRRRRSDREGPDDVEPVYRAEMVPFAMKLETDRDTGRAAASVDLAPFSSWAVRGKPARIVFGADRRPERIAASLMLGTSITIRLSASA